jgi:hypothetical protein
MPNAALVRARSPLELRFRPQRLTDEIVSFLSGVDHAPLRSHENPTCANPAGNSP